MSRIQVLVTTMHQSGFEKYAEMHLQTDAIIANQTNFNGYEKIEINGSHVQLISTSTRGLSRNRNIALAHADQATEFILFSDDDLVFSDGYEALIIEEFEKHPEAEVIKFNLHDLSTRKISMKRISRFEKATRKNMSASGVCGLVVRTETIRKNDLHFNEFFGTGTENYCGEDTIFLMKMLDKKISFFRSPIDIAGINQGESTWFRGFDQKYFFVVGKVFRTIYPKLAYLLAIRGAWRFSSRKDCNMRFLHILRCYLRGIKSHRR